MAATSVAAGQSKGMTTTAGRVRVRGPVLHPRLVAVVTAASCLVHVWLAVSGHHGTWVSVLMLALAAVCVPCTVHIWRHSRAGALRQVTATTLGMVALHAALLLGMGGAVHVHGGRPASYAAPTTGSSQLLLVIGLDLTTALLAATLVARLRRESRLTAARPGA